MNKILLLLLVVPILAVPVFAQESEPIPDWIKVVAGAWANDIISDSDFKNAITFLIDYDIIKLGNNIVPIPDEEKRLYELEIQQRDETITRLTSELNESESTNEYLTTLLQETRNAMEEAKQTQQKAGNIGAEKVSIETIQRLQKQITEYQSVINELENEIRELKSDK